MRIDVERALGEPWRHLEPRDQRVATEVYPVFRDTVSDRGAYYVIEYELADRDEIVYSVQLTGDRPDSEQRFSCLALQDGEGLVRRQLGTPSHVTEFEFRDENVRGFVWWYDPDPVSVEIAHARVCSFRVWRADDIPPQRRTLRLIDQW